MSSRTVKLSDLYRENVSSDEVVTVDEVIRLSNKGKTVDAQYLAGIRQMVVDQVVGSTVEETVKLAKENGYEVEVIEL